MNNRLTSHGTKPNVKLHFYDAYEEGIFSVLIPTSKYIQSNKEHHGCKDQTGTAGVMEPTNPQSLLHQLIATAGIFLTVWGDKLR